MASWSEVKSFIRSNYIVKQEIGPDALLLEFETFAGRSQQIFVEFDRSGDDVEWVSMSATVGLVAELDAMRVLEVASPLILGAVRVSGEALMVAHWQPLATIDGPEIDGPMKLICLVADIIEKDLNDTDRF